MNSQELECTEKVVSDLMMEIARLRNENERLKIENIQIKAEKDEWKDGFTLLHNMIENQEENEIKEVLSDGTLSNEYEEFLNNDAIMYCYNQAYELAENDFTFAGANFSINK